METKEFTFPAGKYYVGDPCYVFHKQWDEIGEKTGWFGCDNDKIPYNGTFTAKSGNLCFAEGTAYGDGTYEDGQGRVYAVDAGLIGLVPLSEVEPENDSHGGNFIDFPDDFQVWAEDGVFHFGHIEINTGDEEEETCYGCGELESNCLCDWEEEDEQECDSEDDEE